MTSKNSKRSGEDTTLVGCKVSAAWQKQWDVYNAWGPIVTEALCSHYLLWQTDEHLEYPLYQTKPVNPFQPTFPLYDTR